MTASDKTDETEAEQEGQGKDKLGRVLDIAGIVAGAIIGVIIFDVLSGGKISRVLARSKPCEGCQDKAEQDQENVTHDG